MTHCPNCQASVQSDASFCGQCGFNLQGNAAAHEHHPSALPPTIAVPPGGTGPSIPTRTPGFESTAGSPSPLPPTVAVPPTRNNAGVQSPLPPTIASVPPDRAPANPAPEKPGIPDLPPPEPIVQPDPLVAEIEMSSNPEANYSSSEPSLERGMDTSKPYTPGTSASPQTNPPAAPVSPPTVAQASVQSAPSQTMLQIQVARLLHSYRSAMNVAN